MCETLSKCLIKSFCYSSTSCTQYFFFFFWNNIKFRNPLICRLNIHQLLHLFFFSFYFFRYPVIKALFNPFEQYQKITWLERRALFATTQCNSLNMWCSKAPNAKLINEGQSFIWLRLKAEVLKTCKNEKFKSSKSEKSICRANF